LYSCPDDAWKLCDYGTVSNGTSRHGEVTTKARGTEGYRPPEMIYPNCKYYNKSDIWAFGCLLAEIARGRMTFDHDWVTKVFYETHDDTESPASSFVYHHMDETSSFWLSEFCGAMLQGSPWKRPTAKDVLQGIDAVLSTYDASPLMLAVQMKWLPHW
jgi:serine/threonine protein kinase